MFTARVPQAEVSGRVPKVPKYLEKEIVRTFVQKKHRTLLTLWLGISPRAPFVRPKTGHIKGMIEGT